MNNDDYNKYKNFAMKNFPSNENNKKTNIEWIKNIQQYMNKSKNKCVNEYEKLSTLNEGAIWKVYLVKRYYYEDEFHKKIRTNFYAMKRTHIMTQYKRRYYKENKMINYFEEVLNEIKIYLILNNKNEFVVKLFQILFDFNNNHQYLYLINEFFDCGCIMNRDNVNYNHFHNPKIIKCFYNMKFEYENENLIKKRFLNMNIKHSIAKIIFKKIFLGLKFIHSNRISHRDIKIENILFDSKDKNPKIIDFSISTIHNNNNNFINEPAGSIHYQAPEIFSDSTIKNKGFYDAFKADVWSVGICLFIFIYEEFPFDGESELQLQINIGEKKLNPPFNSENKDFDSLLEKLLEKDPDKRLTEIDKILECEYFK
jgi:serine/threonine protein kinase